MKLSELKGVVRDTPEYRAVIRDIKAAALAGQQAVTYDGDKISEVIINRLKEDGYDVSYNGSLQMYSIGGR